MKTYLTPTDVTALEAAATCLRDLLLIRLLFRTGCRISEALALTAEDIDLEAGTITIMHLKQRVRLSCHDCGGSLARGHGYCSHCGREVAEGVRSLQERRRQRRLPVDRATVELLREYMHRGGPVLRDGRRLIFGVNRHRAWQIVRECAGRAGLPKLCNPETGKVHGGQPPPAPGRVRRQGSEDGRLQRGIAAPAGASGACLLQHDGPLSQGLGRGAPRVVRQAVGGRAAVTLALRPRRGGFLRPFGCGWFIREFLAGSGPHGSPVIDPAVGAPQADIFHFYKEALRRETALDRATRVEEKRARREKRPINPTSIERLMVEHLARLPYKTQRLPLPQFRRLLLDAASARVG